MPKYPDSFENFHRLNRSRQAKTVAGIAAGFLVFFGGLIYIMSASPPVPQEVEQGVLSSSPAAEEIPPPVVTSSPETSKSPAVAPAVKKVAKKASTNKSLKKNKIAKKKSTQKDNLVCIPPSRLKALEKQVARASRR